VLVTEAGKSALLTFAGYEVDLSSDQQGSATVLALPDGRWLVGLLCRPAAGLPVLRSPRFFLFEADWSYAGEAGIEGLWDEDQEWLGAAGEGELSCRFETNWPGADDLSSRSDATGRLETSQSDAGVLSLSFEKDGTVYRTYKLFSYNAHTGLVDIRAMDALEAIDPSFENRGGYVQQAHLEGTDLFYGLMESSSAATGAYELTSYCILISEGETLYSRTEEVAEGVSLKPKVWISPSAYLVALPSDGENCRFLLLKPDGSEEAFEPASLPEGIGLGNLKAFAHDSETGELSLAFEKGTGLHGYVLSNDGEMRKADEGEAVPKPSVALLSGAGAYQFYIHTFSLDDSTGSASASALYRKRYVSWYDQALQLGDMQEAGLPRGTCIEVEYNPTTREYLRNAADLYEPMH